MNDRESSRTSDRSSGRDAAARSSNSTSTSTSTSTEAVPNRPGRPGASAPATADKTLLETQ